MAHWRRHGDSAHAPDDSFVQLLTPEGERVDHPDFPLTLSDDEFDRCIATSCSCDGSMPKPPPCNGRASSVCGRSRWARKPRKWAPAARSSPATWHSLPTESMASHGVAMSIH